MTMEGVSPLSSGKPSSSLGNILPPTLGSFLIFPSWTRSVRIVLIWSSMMTFLFDDNYVVDQFRELVDYLRVQRECDGKFEDGELFVAAKFPEGLLQVAVGDSCGDEADVMLLAV